MANTFIPGYLAEVKIGADQLEDNVLSGTLTQNKNVMYTPVAGDQEPTAVAGLITSTLSVSGLVSTEDVAKWNTAFESNAVVAVVWGIGDTTGTPDAGEYTGNVLVEALSYAFDADDRWTLSLDALFDEGATYVAPV